MSNNTPSKLRVPQQDLAACTVFQANAEAAQAWAQSLPVANTQLVVLELRNAISELNRVKMTPDVRFSIMEVLYPGLHVALSTMSKRFLNQPLVMPEEPRQMSELADDLYSLASMAYTLVAVHTLKGPDSITLVNPARLLCESIQRALNFAGRKILQTYQLHQPIQKRCWLELHQLYATAERQQLTGLLVKDEVGGDKTIATTYLQSLMLGCCKPNQLRQGDLTAVYRGMQEWGDLIHLNGPDNGKGLFLVDLGSDQPAQYSSLYANTDNPQYRFINTGDLVTQLESLKGESEKSGNSSLVFDKDTSLPPGMLDHLIKFMGSMSTRNFSRSPSGESLGICLGMSSSHYHVAEEKTFEEVLYGEDYALVTAGPSASNRFLQEEDDRDTWEQANPHFDRTHDQEQEYGGEPVDASYLAVLEGQDQQDFSPEERYPIFSVQMIDTSPGGYCLEWPKELPSAVRTGEVVSVREGKDHDWAIAVIRWVSQMKDAKSLIGIELLSPRATAYGARIQKEAEAEAQLMRVLLLPEIKLVGQPNTLITPRAGFKVNQQVVLLREGEKFLIQLLHQISATADFARFNFRYMKLVEQTEPEDLAKVLKSPFNSLWDKI